MAAGAAVAQESADPERILLKDYKPVSLHKTPVTSILMARYPVIDVHSHPYRKTPEEVAEWVKVMDQVGVEKTVVMTQASGKEFDSLLAVYSKYPRRFEVWCGFDYSGWDQPGWAQKAVAELERCVKLGARGVGEEGDKGKGVNWGEARGLHFDDPWMDPLFEKCAELRLPVNLHVADPIWMYQKMDETNDGLMNALLWRLDNQPGIVGHSGMMEILERAVHRHPRTIFIACHFANLDYDLERLGRILDRNPNLYVDISARYAETCVVPRHTARFYERYQDRLLYGTDMGVDETMYRLTFRMLESLDEHFCAPIFEYHWSYSGLGLKAQILRKIYRENALRVLKR
ncbi:MAG: amidohydrolase [Acidobacteria bacterium]|nr:amidohydrolase [Acidobacteriota bacterium]